MCVVIGKLIRTGQSRFVKIFRSRSLMNSIKEIKISIQSVGRRIEKRALGRIPGVLPRALCSIFQGITRDILPAISSGVLVEIYFHKGLPQNPPWILPRVLPGIFLGIPLGFLQLLSYVATSTITE